MMAAPQSEDSKQQTAGQAAPVVGKKEIAITEAAAQEIALVGAHATRSFGCLNDCGRRFFFGSGR